MGFYILYFPSQAAKPQCAGLLTAAHSGVPRARVYFDGEGRGGHVESRSSILPFGTPSSYFHSATLNVAPILDSRDLSAGPGSPQGQDLYVLGGKQDLASPT